MTLGADGEVSDSNGSVTPGPERLKVRVVPLTVLPTRVSRPLYEFVWLTPGPVMLVARFS